MLKKTLKLVAIMMVFVLVLSGCASPSHQDMNPFPSENVETVENIESITEETTVNESSIEETDSTETQTDSEETTESEASQETESKPEEVIQETEVQSENPQQEKTPQKEQPKSEPETTPEQESEQSTDTTTSVQTSTVTVTGTFNYAEAKKMLSLVNAYRKEHGLGEVKWDESLAQATKTRAAEASICWSHTRPNGSKWYTVSNLVKGENLAKGYSTAEETFNAWLASDSHRENILWGDFETMYVAYFEAENGWFWAQEFGY